jgi:hypothetical protein
MAEETKPKPGYQLPQPVATYIEAPDVCEVYSNSLNINWSLFDVRIRFAQIKPIVGQAETPGKPPERKIEDKAAVVLAWAQAKNLRDMLTEAVKRYETVNGEILTNIKLP